MRFVTQEGKIVFCKSLENVEKSKKMISTELAHEGPLDHPIF